MRRDLELIRKILLHIEEADEPLSSDEIEIVDYEPGIVDYHVQLLVEAQYLVGISVASFDNPYGWIGLRLTWDGHDFLDSARNENVWRATTMTIGQQLGTASMEIVKALLIDLAKHSLGLP